MVGCSSVVRYGTGRAATWPSTAARTRSSIGSSVAGPREQFSPTTSAPASASRLQASSGVVPSRITPVECTASVTTVGRPVARMTSSAMSASPSQLSRLRDQEVRPALDGPADLLLEHRPHLGARGVVLGVDVRVGDVAGEQGAGLAGDVARELQRLPVERLEQVLLADDAQLLAVAVVGEGLDHVRAGVGELAVQARDHLGVVEHHGGHEGAGLQVAAALAFEEVALGADDGAGGESVEKSGRAHGAIPLHPAQEGSSPRVTNRARRGHPPSRRAQLARRRQQRLAASRAAARAVSRPAGPWTASTAASSPPGPSTAAATACRSGSRSPSASAQPRRRASSTARRSAARIRDRARRQRRQGRGRQLTRAEGERDLARGRGVRDGRPPEHRRAGHARGAADEVDGHRLAGRAARERQRRRLARRPASARRAAGGRARARRAARARCGRAGRGRVRGGRARRRRARRARPARAWPGAARRWRRSRPRRRPSSFTPAGCSASSSSAAIARATEPTADPSDATRARLSATRLPPWASPPARARLSRARLVVIHGSRVLLRPVRDAARRHAPAAADAARAGVPLALTDYEETLD